MTVAILGHMQKFYDLLDSLAEVTDEGGKQYTGQITNDFNKLDLPIPYYSKMTRLLQDMGCMTRIQRGGRATPSIWVLHFRPTEESFALVNPNETAIDTLNSQVRMYQSSVDQKMRTMRRDVTQLTARINMLNNAVSAQAALIAHLFVHLDLEIPINPDQFVPNDEQNETLERG